MAGLLATELTFALPSSNLGLTVRHSQELFPSGRPNVRSPAPWSPPRPDRAAKLPIVLPSAVAHDTITRASLTYQLDLERARQHALNLKHKAIFNACETLRLHDKALYDLATGELPGSASATVPVLQGRGKVERLFPREMRSPTDTPGTSGWNYDWVYVPEEEAQAKVDFRVRDDLKDGDGTPVATGEGEAAKKTA